MDGVGGSCQCTFSGLPGDAPGASFDELATAEDEIYPEFDFGPIWEAADESGHFPDLSELYDDFGGAIFW